MHARVRIQIEANRTEEEIETKSSLGEYRSTSSRGNGGRDERN